MSREVVVMQIRFCDRIVRRNVGEITHEESLRSFAPAGNCLNWVLGHIVATRSAFLRGLGGEPVWTKAESSPYDRHASPFRDGAEAKPLEEIWRAYDLSLGRLVKAIEALTPEGLAAKVPPELAAGPAGTVEELIAVVGLHDAYHSGQTGIIRRLLGKPPADL